MNYVRLHFGPSVRYLLMLNSHRLIAANNSCSAYGTGLFQKTIQERSHSSSFAGEPALPASGSSHSFFQLHAEPIRNSIDKGEVRNHQSRVEDGPVAPASLTKKLYIVVCTRRGLAREFDRKIEGGKFSTGYRRVSVV